MSTTTGLMVAALGLAIVVVWVIAKVRYYARKSEEQWSRVDKSKLVVWHDEDD